MSTIAIIIILSLIFDYINGFHDAANSIATVVSTKVLTPFQAVLWSALFNFMAFFIFKEHGIANTIAKTVDFSKIEMHVSEAVDKEIKLLIILSGVLAAIIWNLITWWFGIPSSSSHTLIGGFVGSTFLVNGIKPINIPIIIEITIFIFLAPLIGMIFGILISFITIQRKVFLQVLTMIILGFLLFYFSPLKNNFEIYGFLCIILSFIIVYLFIYYKKLGFAGTVKIYKRMQLVSSAIISLAHGGNDAQKVMGIIWAALIINGNLSPDSPLPDWIAFSCYSAIALGTIGGGWKIIKTMGNKITRLTPLEGVCAETAASITLFFAASLKIPVSTTHTTTGAIIGAGSAKRISAVRWGITSNLLVAWIITIPITAIISSFIYMVLNYFYFKF